MYILQRKPIHEKNLKIITNKFGNVKTIPYICSVATKQPIKPNTMNVVEVTNEIKKLDLFKDLVLYEPTDASQYGTIKVTPRHFRDSKKNEIKASGVYSLFIAHMYKDRTDMEEFFYLSFYHIAEQRDYRRRTWGSIEYNKIFVTGNSVDEIIKNLKDKLIGYVLK